MLTLINQGMGYGFAAGVSPGPFMNYLLTTTLTRGWRAGLVTILAPLISDIPIVIFTVILLGSLSDSAISVMKIIGGLFTLYIAWGTYQQYRAGTVVGELKEGEIPTRGTLTKAVLMNFLNPNPYLFWGTINGPILISALKQSAWHGLVFLFSFYGVFLGMMALQVLIFDRLGRINPQVTRRALLLAIVILAILGVSLLRQGLSG
ncbi:MAG: LysE family transporter [Chitinophagaceae bacterium]|nr:LysE family transporter [Anaerolineae bacterium]